MYLWTNEEIGKILIQLEEREKPFPKYAFERRAGELCLLGRGGSALVYGAASRANRRKKYAIKVIGFGEGRVDFELFKSTVEAQKKIGFLQNNVVKVYDYTELFVWLDEDGHVTAVQEEREEVPGADCLKLQFILMEKLDCVLSRGSSGKRKLIPSALEAGEEREILRLAYDIGTALANAHQNNILHRDVKLENIFYDPKGGHYKLGDFGIAKVTDSGLASTAAFTRGYGAPEVVGNLEEVYDHTADIYSFGILLYVLQNGLEFPDPKAQYREGYVFSRPSRGSEGLYPVTERMCRYYPDERYPFMNDVLNDLEKLIFYSRARYKREHKYASLALGSALLFSGVAAWKLIFCPGLSVELSAAMYALFFLSAGKCILHLRRRKVVFVSAVILGVGIFLLVTEGFSWIKLLVLLGITFSSGNFAGLFSGSILTANMVYLITEHNPGLWLPGRDHRWIAVTLLSLSAVMLYQYWFLNERDRVVGVIYLKGNRYWIVVSLIYASMIVNGAVFRKGQAVGLLGEGLVRELMTYDLMKVGAVGLGFCIAWMIRERVLARHTGG